MTFFLLINDKMPTIVGILTFMGGKWRKYVHEVLVNRLYGLSLPRKIVIRLTDRPDMTLDVYRGRKTTMQQQQWAGKIAF